MDNQHVVFLNVAADRRLNLPLYYRFADKYNPLKRIDKVEQFVREHVDMGHIVCLAEVDSEMYKMLYERCPASPQYTIYMSPYNRDPDAFKFVIFVPTCTYAITEFNPYPLTSDFTYVDPEQRPSTDEARRASAEYMDKTGGELFEKSFCHLVVNVLDDPADLPVDASDPPASEHPPTDSDIQTRENKTSKYKNSFHLFVTHMGLGKEQKVLQSKRLVEWINTNMIEPTKLPHLIIGDFNAFDGGNICQPQMDVFMSNGYTQCVPFTRSTFTPYEYDQKYLFDDSTNVAEYDALVARARNTELTENEMKMLQDQFYELCMNAPRKENPSIALDNAFVKNMTVHDVIVTCRSCDSDHASIHVVFSV